MPTILVTGATGTQGGAVARHLLKAGMTVRALTRKPDGAAAKALVALGAAIVQGDLGDRESLVRAFSGADGVYAVTDFFKNGIPAEIEQGKRMADVAKETGVGHFVLASVAFPTGTSGVPHFDSKREIERHVESLGIRYTFLRPSLFMEDLTEKKYVPPGTWGMTPKLVGRDRPIRWIAIDDVGAAAARVFADPEAFAGRAVSLAGDELSIAQARELFRKTDGKAPLALPMPTWLFRRLVSEDLVLMWQWLATHDFDSSVAETKLLLPGVRDMATWLREKRASAAAAR